VRSCRSFGVIDTPKEAARAGDGIIQILIRTPLLSPIEFGGVEQIEIDPF